jgi:tRNA-dihydrouridine synthase B
VTIKEVEEIEAVLAEIEGYYTGFEVEHTPIELINYHEKCPV